MLMNLGVGMSQELTARENIYVSGSVLGLKIKEVDKLFDEIVDFAEIKSFIDTKVKFFSSGMMARLAFSIAVNAGADIMFLDEIFAVGDMKFQEKAIRVFESSWIKGKTVILVSHGMPVIKQYCSRAAFMKNGQIEFFGETAKAIELYTADNQSDRMAGRFYLTVAQLSQFLFISKQKRNKKPGQHSAQATVKIDFSDPCYGKCEYDQYA